MKKLYTFLVVAFIGLIGNAQIVNIPDANFKAKLLAASPTATIAYNSSGTKIKIDTNNDGDIQVSEALIVYQLYVSSTNTAITPTSIVDLTGLESFTNLRTFSCTNNNVSVLNLTPLVNLKVLSCGNNPLMSINLSSLVNLENLTCHSNQLTSLNLSNNNNLKTISCYNNSISNLSITNCNNLTSLDCSSNQLSPLDVSNKVNLTNLNCNNNIITDLNIANSYAFTSFSCAGNQLTSLDITNRLNLTSLNCTNNQLTSLNITNDLALIDLSFSSNQIQTINLDPFINIETLGLGGNPYTSPVNLSTLVNLYWLDAQNIESVDVFPLNATSMPLLTNLKILKTDGSNLGNFNYALIPNLEQLLCRNTDLTNINSIPTTLTTLVVEANQLTSLDLTAFTNLTAVNAYNNQITNLVLGNHPEMYFLTIGKNLFPNIDVSHLPALTTLQVHNSQNLVSCNIKNGASGIFGFSNCPNLLYICADEAEVVTAQNDIVTNAANWNGNPNCHVNTYCTFEPGGTFFSIQGNHRWDTTNNGCDTNDFLFPNMKFNISNGTTTTTLISSNDGSYHYDVPAGTYTVTPVLENPSYFLVTPSNTGNIVFPTATSPFVRDFCVRSVANNPDLEVVVYPLSNPRPGVNNRFNIVYKNKGGIPQNGSVNFSFDDAIQDMVSTTVTPNIQTSGNLTWNFTNLLPFETRSLMVTFNLNTPIETPPVEGGDILNYGATITGILTDILPSDNSASVTQTVVNSQDPNDKTCVEGISITPSMVGQYVHYVIRFENTGTANAINIVVKDIIDTTKFDIASLIPQSSSHSFYTRIINTNQVEFVFENINLPFDDANNDGYVAFKIKTKPTLVLGDAFSNGSSIYFDYNAPIVTNTFTTTVQALGNQDFEFGSIFSLSPVPTKNTLTITTKETVSISSINIYNTLGQLVQVNTNPSETIDVSGLQSGSYFIKIISDKGSATGKFVKE